MVVDDFDNAHLACSHGARVNTADEFTNSDTRDTSDLFAFGTEEANRPRHTTNPDFRPSDAHFSNTHANRTGSSRRTIELSAPAHNHPSRSGSSQPQRSPNPPLLDDSHARRARGTRPRDRRIKTPLTSEAPLPRRRLPEVVTHHTMNSWSCAFRAGHTSTPKGDSRGSANEREGRCRSICRGSATRRRLGPG
jgi:hypothetical protein